MSTGNDVLTATDWKRTFHAYGLGTDVPEHLSLLLSDDPRDHALALDHLYSAIVHQGSVYPATVPAARFAAGLLADPRGTLLADLLCFLRDAAEAGAGYTDTLAPPPLSEAERDRLYTAIGSDDEDEATDIWEDEAFDSLMYHETGVALRDAAPELYAAVRPHLTHPDALIRIGAVEAAGAIARLGGLTPDLSGAADMAETRDEAAVIVLALGGTGGDTAEFLTHGDPAIRACAALAPGLRGDPAALAELVAAACDQGAAESWFTRCPAYFGGSARVRLVLAREAVHRCGPGDAGAMLPLFRALAPAVPAGVDLGPVLEAAFPEGAPARPSEVQRDYLRVLADTAQPRTGTGGNGFGAVLERLGLPTDRDALRALATS